MKRLAIALRRLADRFDPPQAPEATEGIRIGEASWFEPSGGFSSTSTPLWLKDGVNIH